MTQQGREKRVVYRQSGNEKEKKQFSNAGAKLGLPYIGYSHGILHRKNLR